MRKVVAIDFEVGFGDVGMAAPRGVVLDRCSHRGVIV